MDNPLTFQEACQALDESLDALKRALLEELTDYAEHLFMIYYILANIAFFVYLVL